MDFQDAGHAAQSKFGVTSAFIEFPQGAQGRDLTGRVAQLAKVGVGIVKTGLGLFILSYLSEGSAQLSPCGSQPFFVACLFVEVNCLLEKGDGLLQATSILLLQAKVAVEHSQRIVILNLFE